MQDPLIAHVSPRRDPFLPSSHLVDPSPLLSLLSTNFLCCFLSLLSPPTRFFFSPPPLLPACFLWEKKDKIPRRE